MARLLVHVEGQTEEQFVNELLARYLYACGYAEVSARLIGNARQRQRRGGIVPWRIVRKEITNRLKEDREILATSMVDYYGLPRAGSGAWPGREAASALPYPDNVSSVEHALLEDVKQEMGEGFNSSRFVPFVMIHEFEALRFSNCATFAQAIRRADLTSRFQGIRDAFPNPEQIDDSPKTAPSKRIEDLFPRYQKPLMGVLAAQAIGLEAMRTECPHFDSWLDQLEAAVA